MKAAKPGRASAGASGAASGRSDPSAGNAKKLLDAPLDRVALARARLPYERLDQLTMEVIMGIR